MLRGRIWEEKLGGGVAKTERGGGGGVLRNVVSVGQL